MKITETQKRYLGLVALMLVTAAAALSVGMDGKQTISATTMMTFIYGTLLFWRMRVAFAFAGISALFVFGVLDVPHFVEFASLDIIVFLIAMMVVVGFLEKNQFFEVIVSKLLRFSGHSGTKSLILFMCLAALSAALVDEVTSILFMTSIMLHMTSKLKVNPIPFVLMIVFATNIGSSATVVGNPVGVLIALRAGLSFPDFLRWAAPISFLSLLVLIPLAFRMFSEPVKEYSNKLKAAKGEIFEQVRGHNMFVSGIVFAVVLALLLSHHSVEEALHLSKNTLLLGAALIGAAIVLFAEGDNARNILESRVDWWTIVFFMMLFASVGSLKYVGVTDVVAQEMLKLIGTNPVIALAVVMLSIGVLSAMLDNVLAVAIFIPIVQSLGAAGVATGHLWWGMLFGGTLFGNLTPIGSTANIVAIGILERRGLPSISLFEWMKYALPIVVITAAVAFIAIYLQLSLLI